MTIKWEDLAKKSIESPLKHAKETDQNDTDHTEEDKRCPLPSNHDRLFKGNFYAPRLDPTNSSLIRLWCTSMNSERFELLTVLTCFFLRGAQ